MSFLGRLKTDKNQKIGKASKTAKTAVKAAQKDEEKKVEEQVAERPISSAKDVQFPAYRVLLKPIITEKTTYLMSNNTYCFSVGAAATKTEVRKAVGALYGVKVIGVRMINRAGKKVRFGRTAGQRRNVKKAYVTLAEGQHIEIHKNV